jgi:uncharacterized membrane protein
MNYPQGIIRVLVTSCVSPNLIEIIIPNQKHQVSVLHHGQHAQSLYHL